MKNVSSVVAMMIFAGAGVAAADDVDVSFIDNGGIIYKVNPSGFIVNQAYGSQTADGYLVPRAGQLRNGCFLSTPWLPVNHAAGKAHAFPHFTLEWWGEVNPVAEPDDTLLRLTLEVKRANGTTSQIRSYVHTGLLDLQLRYYTEGPNRVYYYYGRLDNPLASHEDKLFGNIAVNDGDQVRYNVCDLYEGGKLLLRDVQVSSYPVF